MEKKSENIDFVAALRFFFDLPDWQTRSKEFALLYIAMLVGTFIVYILASIIFIIPILGWIVGSVMFLALFLGSIAFNLYILGYKLEVADAVSKGGDISEVKVLGNWKGRIMNVLGLGVAQLIYTVPVIILYVIALFALFGFIATAEATNADAYAVPGIVIFYGIIFLAGIVQFLIQTFIYPVMHVLYLEDKSIVNIMNPTKIWNFLVDNLFNILLYIAAMLLASFVIGIASLIAMITVLVCIGIILYPAVIVVGQVYSVHMQAYIFGQMAKLNKKKDA